MLSLKKGVEKDAEVGTTWKETDGGKDSWMQWRRTWGWLLGARRQRRGLNADR